MGTESPSVLLIEDHEDTRKMLALLFDEWGYQATLAPTATEGLKHLLEQRYDLLILANWLPALDCGANAFVSKGSNLGELREAMAAQLKKTNGKPPRPF